MSKGYADIDYLDRKAELLYTVKEREHSHLQLAAGHRVLDVGFGPGADTLAMASVVGPTGLVAGVDHDAAMVAEAQRRATAAGCGPWVTHQVADAASLPFDDGYFDGARSAQLFQHLLAPASSVLAEMVRVTKHGGRVVVADTDWGSLSVHSRETDIERRIIQCNAERCFNNGYSGRSLPGLFRQHGSLAGVTVEAVPIFTVDYQLGRQLLLLDQVEQEALQSKVVMPEELERWRGDLQDLDERGAFFMSLTVFIVAARKT